MANKPVHEVRLGTIKAAIWASDTQSGIRHNVTLSRLYKDGDQWRSSDSFGRDDLPVVAKVADMAHTWIFQNGHATTDTAPPPESRKGQRPARRNGVDEASAEPVS